MINGNYIWQVNAIEPIDENYDNLNSIILQLLKKRGVVGSDQIYKYLNPKLDYLYDPMLLKDMDKAIAKIRDTIEKGQKITVYGDYDVDGITSCTILVKILKKLGANVDYYIPSRINEGYGLSLDAVKYIFENHTKLIITVDNGIRSCDEVDYAKSLGMDVIITDHHEPPQEIPRATAVINPKQSDCNYPFKELAGVGVALKLVQGLMNKSEIESEFIELAAVGTIADVVPLLDENRIIVKNGLEALANAQNAGLRAIMKLLNLRENPIEPRKISYLLAPRLNAPGRIADPNIVVELLLCEDEARAIKLANAIEKINQERQAIEAKVLDEAKTIIERKIDLNLESIIVISSSAWHPGVIGIVASKLAETYGRPCILIAEEGDEGRGSGRSILGFNLFKAIDKFSHYLIKFGGHEQAAGLTIKVENINPFRKALNQFCKINVKQSLCSPKLNIDLELNQCDINLELARQIELMKPFGYGNPKPVFMCKNMKIKSFKAVGDNHKHLKLNLKSSDNNFDAIGFNFGHYIDELNMASIMDIAFCLEINRWRGNAEPQLNIKDLKVPFFRDSLLHNIEKHYYPTFCTNLEKKDFKNFTADNFICGENCTFQDISFKEKIEYINELVKTKRKVLIVVNTPYKAWQLLKHMKKDKDMVVAIKEFYNAKFVSESDSSSILLIDPFANFSNLRNFEDIVFYDLPFSKDILKYQITSVSKSAKIHILFKQSDLRYNYLVCQYILPNISDLKYIFQTLRNWYFKKNFYSVNLNELKDYLQRQYDIDIHNCALINVFNIFQDLGILKYDIKDEQLSIWDYKRHEGRFKLESSKTFMKLYMVKKNIVDFYKDFFTIQSKILKYGGN